MCWNENINKRGKYGKVINESVENFFFVEIKFGCFVIGIFDF